MHIVNINELGKWLSSEKPMCGWVKSEGWSSFRFLPMTSTETTGLTKFMWMTCTDLIPPVSALDKLVKKSATNALKGIFVVTKYGVYLLSMLGHPMKDGRVMYKSRIHSPLAIYGKLLDMISSSSSSFTMSMAMRVAKKLGSFVGVAIEFFPVDYSEPTWTILPSDPHHSTYLNTLVYVLGIGSISLLALMYLRSLS
jgi:hypothetical protein